MKFLAVTRFVFLGDIYLNLMREGHAVRVAATGKAGTRAFDGLIAVVPDWQAELAWVGRDGIILFEGVGRGAEQDALRAAGYRVIGGSALGDRLETNRAYGQAILADLGLPMAQSEHFADAAGALASLAETPRRTVLKYDGGRHTTFVGDHPAGLDVAYILRRQAQDAPLLLMDRVAGVEVGIGAYFDGRQFLQPACIDFEHKRFFPGELGEMTGEMGTLASYEGASALFDATLGRMASMLAHAGHIGYLNLNLIVDERGPVPLEFTCRIGNPGFAVLAAMQCDGWGDLFLRMAEGSGGRFQTLPGWSVAIVLTVPPFPHTDPAAEPGDDLPVFWHAPPTARELPYYHYVDMRLQDGQLLVHRRSGHVMITTGTGPSIAAAQSAARTRAANVIVPELRWRQDIGDRVMNGEAAMLQQLGWL